MGKRKNVYTILVAWQSPEPRDAFSGAGDSSLADLIDKVNEVYHTSVAGVRAELILLAAKGVPARLFS